MKIPLIKTLRKKEYRDIASLQDEIIEILYRTENSIVLHGGTVVWRCFGGKRFSTDIDAYMTNLEIEKLKKTMISAASDYDINMKKIKDTGNLLFMVFETGETNLKVEINHKKKGLNTTVTRFEKADGTYTDVLTLPPEDLILEKINAYSDRRFIRDIYDIYILSSYVENPEKIREKTTEFLKNIKKPLNENQLAALIYEGPVPSFNNMITIIKGRLT